MSTNTKSFQIGESSISSTDLSEAGDDLYTAPDFAATALITIDVQRDVLDGGPFEVPGTSAALGSINVLLRAFRDTRQPVVHIVRLYCSDGTNADLCRRRAVERGMRVLTPGDPGCQLARELLPHSSLELDAGLLLAGGVQRLGPDEVAIYKSRWGAFYDTPLEDHLRKQGITTLVFCGCNFPNCPRTSIYEASERDFKTVLVTDATSGLYERGLRELVAIGVNMMRADEVADALASRRRFDARGEGRGR